MPHRRGFATAADEKLESTLGRFYVRGLITQSQFDAGIRYAGIVLDYLRSVGAPAPYGGNIDDLTDDQCFQAKIQFSQAREILKGAAPAGQEKAMIAAVDRLAVYGEDIKSFEEMGLLRVGLQALAHGSNVIPFSRPAPRVGQ